MKCLKGHIVTPKGTVEGEIYFEQKITKIEKRKVRTKNMILPGFIDLHLHGGGGRDLMEAGDAAGTISRIHAKNGTTSYLPTVSTASEDDLLQAIMGIRQSGEQRKAGEACILGVHLEGPYINDEKLGAQPKETREFNLSEIQKLNDVYPLKIITLAPELLSDLEMITQLGEAGIVVQLGHTNASYEQAREALHAGAKSFTHLYNAMSGLHHRNPGAVGAALANAQFAELILDFVHVHPGACLTALRAVPKLYFVTDATAASGMADGAYKLGTQIVHKCQGGVRLSDGTLAGSCLTMQQVFKNALGLGLAVEEVSRRCSLYPAELIGVKDRGRLALRSYADIVVMDEECNITDVYLEGKKI
ncbi:MAG: N-acetylglucosamine-6-phosphate deacetylase [Bdellovibrionales bacterium GWA2_49_15]|nr:MAG: N-acetylglucosamine-6-phosphate deacetylase [Bdellovibrionales bacterium GWA2_49_15]HAZ11602.1 N-acetylglucosamine-6-phosphate deacetylase [Bdellovibrionales bacterium]